MKLLALIVWPIKKSRLLSALAMRLVKLTGKSKYPIHPKHLIKIEPLWYLSRINAKDIVLDIGCNNGQHTLKTALKCKKIIGLDYDAKQLQIARNIAKDKKITNAIFKQFNLEKKLVFKDKSFDKILCLDVLEHIVKRGQLLKEIKRLLKPKGLAFIAIPNVATTWKQWQLRAGLNPYADPDHKIEYTLDEVKTMFKPFGLEIIKIKPTTYDSPWIGFLDLLGGISLKLYARLAKIKQQKAANNLRESTGFRIIVKRL